MVERRVTLALLSDALGDVMKYVIDNDKFENEYYIIRNNLMVKSSNS